MQRTINPLMLSEDSQNNIIIKYCGFGAWQNLIHTFLAATYNIHIILFQHSYMFGQPQLSWFNACPLKELGPWPVAEGGTGRVVGEHQVVLDPVDHDDPKVGPRLPTAKSHADLLHRQLIGYGKGQQEVVLSLKEERVDLGLTGRINTKFFYRGGLLGMGEILTGFPLSSPPPILIPA